MRPGSIAAIVVVVLGIGLFVYWMFLTPHMDTNATTPRRPNISDQPSPKRSTPPFVESNVPPATK
jgi:hypothetical protein